MFVSDPAVSNAHLACLWELGLYLHHVHPTVAFGAKMLLGGTNPPVRGDPLQANTLAAFLAKFMDKEPRKLEERRAKVVRD